MNILNTLALIACLAAPAAHSTPSTPSTPSTLSTGSGQAGSGQGAQTPAATPAPDADVLGTWDVSVTTSQSTIPSQLKLRKDGDKIVGMISSHMGEVPVEAAVKGNGLTILFTFQGQNGPMAIELAGTVTGDKIAGTMGAGGQLAGDWVATRAKDAAEKPKEPAPSQPAAAKTDLTGTWGVSVELPNITATPTVVLKQDGEKLTGEYLSAQYGKFPVTGTVKGADVSFWFAMNVEGNGLNVTYTGTADKDGVLKGSVNYGDMMSGTFVAKKK